MFEKGKTVTQQKEATWWKFCRPGDVFLFSKTQWEYRCHCVCYREKRVFVKLSWGNLELFLRTHILSFGIRKKSNKLPCAIWSEIHFFPLWWLAQVQNSILRDYRFEKNFPYRKVKKSEKLDNLERATRTLMILYTRVFCWCKCKVEKPNLRPYIFLGIDMNRENFFVTKMAYIQTDLLEGERVVNSPNVFCDMSDFSGNAPRRSSSPPR